MSAVSEKQGDSIASKPTFNLVTLLLETADINVVALLLRKTGCQKLP
jgi:hypothetical protein